MKQFTDLVKYACYVDDSLASSDSSGESDSLGSFFVRKPVWRSEAYDNFLTILRKDMLKTSEGQKAVKGERKRVEGGRRRKLSDRSAPKGLTEDCYSVSWLSSLSEVERKVLEVKKVGKDVEEADDDSMEGEEEDEGTSLAGALEVLAMDPRLRPRI